MSGQPITRGLDRRSFMAGASLAALVAPSGATAGQTVHVVSCFVAEPSGPGSTATAFVRSIGTLVPGVVTVDTPHKPAVSIVEAIAAGTVAFGVVLLGPAAVLPASVTPLAARPLGPVVVWSRRRRLDMRTAMARRTGTVAIGGPGGLPVTADEAVRGLQAQRFDAVAGLSPAMGVAAGLHRIAPYALVGPASAPVTLALVGSASLIAMIGSLRENMLRRAAATALDSFRDEKPTDAALLRAAAMQVLPLIDTA